MGDMGQTHMGFTDLMGGAQQKPRIEAKPDDLLDELEGELFVISTCGLVVNPVLGWRPVVPFHPCAFG
eukprot:560977-Pyramimonas_sp.AAC.1